MARFQMKARPGKFYLRSGHGIRLIKAGDIIDCDPYEIRNHLNKFNHLDPEPSPAPQVEKLRAVKRSDGTGYDIVSSMTGSPINDTPLSFDEAISTADAIDDIDYEQDESKGTKDDEPTKGQ